MSVLISVIIPSYKPQSYLNDCLEALNRQSLNKNLFEVIIILNGDKEPYYSVINSQLQIYSFRIILLYTNKIGVSNARNIGLQYACGKYVCFIDDDDYVSSGYLEQLYEKALNNPTSIIVSNVITVSAESEYGYDYIGYAYEYFSRHQSKSIIKKRSFLSSSCCKMIPLAIIADRKFDTRFKLGEDSLFMFAISDKITDIICSPNSAIYYIRQRPNSASRSKHGLADSLVNKWFLTLAYCKIYTKNFYRYNFFLFLSRILAVIINKSV